jgi:hypothetical protein
LIGSPTILEESTPSTVWPAQTTLRRCRCDDRIFLIQEYPGENSCLREADEKQKSLAIC